MSEEDLLKEIEWLRAELAATHAAIDRVRALHVPHACGHCIECSAWTDDGHMSDIRHPCPTLRALDGEDA